MKRKPLPVAARRPAARATRPQQDAEDRPPGRQVAVDEAGRPILLDVALRVMLVGTEGDGVRFAVQVSAEGDRAMTDMMAARREEFAALAHEMRDVVGLALGEPQAASDAEAAFGGPRPPRAVGRA